MTTAPFQLLVLAVAGWVNRSQQEVIAYLQAENRVLREQLAGRRVRFSDAERCRLAAAAKKVGLLNHLTGVCTNAPDAQRALEFLDLLFTDDGLYHLLAKGIEGRHWNWQDAGLKVINPLPGGDWNPGGDWLFGNQFLAYPEDAQEVGMWNPVRLQNEGARLPGDGGFVFDPSPVAAEMEAIESLVAQYDAPMRWGLVPPGDPNKGVYAFNRMMGAAGLEKVLQEIQRQLDAYLTANSWILH